MTIYITQYTGTAVENIALILIIVSLIKLIVITIKPTAWLNGVVKKMYKPSKVTPYIFLILAIIVLYYLTQGGLTIIQILAVMLFTGLIIGAGFSIYSEEMLKLADKVYKQGNIMRNYWHISLIWLFLLLWGLKELFF